MIDLNTDQLQTAVQIARSANAAISDAANLLNSVVSHNDWQCPERSEINDNTSRNRSQILTLQTDAERLYNNICFAAEQFLAAEQELASSFNNVDAPIASFLSKVPMGGGFQGVFNTDVMTDPILTQHTGNMYPQLGSELGNLLKPGVEVISFKDMVDGLQDK